MEKRGISASIAVILMILIVVAGIGILWGVLLPLIRDNTSFGGYEVDLVIDTEGGYTYYDEDKKVACVQVRRGNDELNLSRIDVFFGFNGTSHISNFSGVEIPAPNQAKTKCFNLVDYGVAPESIRVSPVIWDGNKEVVGEVSSESNNVRDGTYPGDQTPAANLDKPRKGGGGGPSPPSEGCGDNCVLDPILVTACDEPNPDGSIKTYRLAEAGREYILQNDVEQTINHLNCFEFMAEGITFDLNGNGIGLDGIDYLGATGINSNGYDDLVIRNGTIGLFTFGISVRGNNITIEEINVSSITIGINLLDVSNSSIRDVIITKVHADYSLRVSDPSTSANNVFTNIKINGSGGGGFANTGTGIFLSSSGNSFNNLTITNLQYGINLRWDGDNEFRDSNIINNENGIYFHNADSNRFYNNNISNNDNGVHLLNSYDNRFYNNNISNNDRGVYYPDLGVNTFYSNTILNNGWDLYCDGGGTILPLEDFVYGSNHNCLFTD